MTTQKTPYTAHQKKCSGTVQRLWGNGVPWCTTTPSTQGSSKRWIRPTARWNVCRVGVNRPTTARKKPLVSLWGCAGPYSSPREHYHGHRKWGMGYSGKPQKLSEKNISFLKYWSVHDYFWYAHLMSPYCNMTIYFLYLSILIFYQIQFVVLLSCLFFIIHTHPVDPPLKIYIKYY